MFRKKMTSNNRRGSKVKYPATLAILIALSGCSQVSDKIIGKVMYQRMLEGFAQPRIATLPDGLHVFLCGAGSPLPDPKRSGPCVAVLAGEQLYVVDAGSGSPRNLGPNGFPPGRIDAVLLSHLHSDHIDSLGELNLLNWVQGQRQTPLKVYGPEGVDKVIAGFNLSYEQDARYRVAHHGEDTVPPAGIGMKAVTLPKLQGDDSKLILKKAGLTITAFAVQHEPVHQALGFRFDYKGRSVVISGDTRQSASVLKQAKGVDVLVHEALDPELLMVMETAAADAGVVNMAKITRDIVDYHTTPEQAAETAAEAGAAMLLFYHIVPALPLAIMEGRFLEGVDERYRGKVELGKDGTLVSLPASSSDIIVEN